MLPLTLAAAAFALSARTAPVPEWEAPNSKLDPYRFVAPQDEVERLGADGAYFQIAGGFTSTTESEGPLEGSTGEEIDFEEGWGLAAALGTRWGAEDDNAIAWDLGLEGYFSDQDLDNDSFEDVTLAAGFVNLLADFALAERLSLFGGGGVGVAWVDVGNESDSVDDFDSEDGAFLSWQLKGGLRLWASEKVAWHVAYRFLNVEDVEVESSDEAMTFDLETQQHMIELGVRFQL